MRGPLTFLVAMWLLLLLNVRFSHGQTRRFDVAVYGATPAGISAAISVARLGMSVGLFEELYQVGGMATGGLSHTDFRTKESLQGCFREFTERVLADYVRRYGADSKQVRDSYFGTQTEPHVARAVVDAWLAEYPTIRLFTRHQLQTTQVEGKGNPHPRLTKATFLDLKTGRSVAVGATAFIDATYEGDLMAKAGCAYRLGRESRQTYGELFAGMLFYHDFRFWLGSTGAADKAIQASNFRICMTDSATNRLTVPRPAGYDRETYRPLLTAMHQGRIRQFKNSIVAMEPLPNRKVDVNDKHFAGSMSLSRPGWNHRWPEAPPAERQAIFDRHKQYTLGLLYFVQNDTEVPDSIRQEAREWGLPNDEFADNAHFTPSLYIREGRRLEGVTTFTEQDCQQAPNSVRGYFRPDAVAVGDYGLNSHGCNPPTTYHPTIRDGAFSLFYSNLPYQIPYGVMVPRRIDGLLVPVAVSASHVGYAALRYEPTWAALGQAAGLAAAQAIRQKRELRRVDVSSLQSDLHKQGASTVYFSDVDRTSPDFILAQFFGSRGYFHDLPAWGTVPYVNHLKFVRGQYTSPFPYHAADLDKQMDDRLTHSWLKRSGRANPTRQQSVPARTRRQFLQALYSSLNP